MAAMCTYLSKPLVIFLLLALSGLIFLLRNMQNLEMFNCKGLSVLSQFQSEVDASFRLLDGALFEQNHNSCWSAGLRLSGEEAREQRRLLASIAWPDPRPPSWHPRRSSHAARSSFTLKHGDGVWHVGELFMVSVHMRDFQGRPKRHGGDFLLARLHSPELGAGCAGHVLDHANGSYSVWLRLLWAGLARVEVTLVHSSEAVRVLKRLREEQPNRVYFKSLFHSGSFAATTVCNMCLPSQQPLCNYTNPRTGEPWFCYKPKLLSCDTRVNHAKGGYQKHLLTGREELLFQRNINIKVPVRAAGSDRLTVLPQSKGSRARPNTAGVNFMPSGFYYNGVWQSTGVPSARQFNTSRAIIRCLQGKTVHMFGDSTARQWFEYLSSFIPDLKEFYLHSPKKVGPFMSVDSAHDITLMYRCHGPPIRFSTVEVSQLRYVADELDAVSGGPDTVVVVSVWSHFSTFPVEVYMRRVRAIRAAVLRLLRRSPRTLVAIRTANPQALDPEVSLFNSDWYSLQLDVVLRGMFQGVGVMVVDAWQLSLAHWLPHALHPPPDIIRNTINLFLSHVCPAQEH